MEAKWRKHIMGSTLDIDKCDNSWKVTIDFRSLDVIGSLDKTTSGVLIRGGIWLASIKEE